MSRRNPQPHLEAKVTLRGGDCQYADYWPGRTPGEIVKELGVTLREVELISAEKGKGWVRIYPRAKKNPKKRIKGHSYQQVKRGFIDRLGKLDSPWVKGRGSDDKGLPREWYWEPLGRKEGEYREGAFAGERALPGKEPGQWHRLSLNKLPGWDHDAPWFWLAKHQVLWGDHQGVGGEEIGRHESLSQAAEAAEKHWRDYRERERKGKEEHRAFEDRAARFQEWEKRPRHKKNPRAKKNAYRHSDLQHVHDYDFPVGRKNARGAIPAIGRGERHGYAPESSLRRKERSIDEISEIVDTMKASPGALRPFEQRKKARKKGQTRIVRPKGNPVEYLTASEYIKGLDAGLFKVDDPRIKVLSEKKPRHATPKEAYADGFSAARSAWHSGQHGFSDIGYWILKNAKDGSLFEERSTFGDEYRRGAKEYWLARRDAESRRTGWEGSDWLERGLNNPLRIEAPLHPLERVPGHGHRRGGMATSKQLHLLARLTGYKVKDLQPYLSLGEATKMIGLLRRFGAGAGKADARAILAEAGFGLLKNNPLHPKPGIPTVWAEYRDDPDDPDDEIRLVCKVVGGRGMGRVRRNPSVKVGNKVRTSRGEEGEVTEIRGTWGYVAGDLEGWFPLSSLSQMRVLNNPDWKALGQKTKRGAQKGWKATKHAGKVAAWQAKGAALKTELADLRRCAKNLGYDDYKSGPAYQAAQERVSAWKEKRPVKQNPVWVSPEGTAGYLSGESHTRYKKKHPQRGLVPKFMERQVRLETPLQDPPSGYRILEFEVTERGRPVTHFRIYEGMRDTGKYARDWNKAVQIAHKLAKKGREALKAAANPRVRWVPASPNDIKCSEQGEALTERQMASILGLSPHMLRRRLEERKAYISGGTYQAKWARKNPRGRRDMTMLIGEDGAEWAKWSQNREGIIHRNPSLEAKRRKIQDQIDLIDHMIDGATRYGPGAEFGGGGHGPAAAQIRAWVAERADLVEALRKLGPSGETTIPPLRNPSARQRKKAKQWTIYHADHGIGPKQMAYIKKFVRKSAPQGFFITQWRFPKSQGLGTVHNAMWGPEAGDRPVPESQVHYKERGDRPWTDRMIDRPPRPVNYGQVLGIRDGDSFTLFTVYGGPLAPLNPADPDNQDVAGSKKFWKNHALSSQQWKGNPQVLYFPGKGAGGSGPRGGYSPAERAELPRGAFLKPGSRSWPVSDKEHAKIALQYMTRGFGNRNEYPLLLQRLAAFWPVDQNPDIWAKYRQYQPDIEDKCRCRLPTVEELRDVGPSPRDWPPVRKNKGTQRRRRRTTHWYK